MRRSSGSRDWVAQSAIIYLNDRSRRVEFIRLVCSLFGIASLAWGWSLSQTYGLAPADGASLRSATERHLMGGFVALLGAAAMAGTLVFCSRYVLRIERTHEDIRITTAGAIRRRTRGHPVTGLVNCKSHNGEHFLARRVNAPWMTLTATGMRIPYVIDPQSAHFDARKIESLVRPSAQRPV